MTTAAALKSVSLEAPVTTLPIERWQPVVSAALASQAVEALESGQILLLPSLGFSLLPEEAGFLDPACVDPSTKSVKYSLSGDRVWGHAAEAQGEGLRRMLRRYAEASGALMNALFPAYADRLVMGNTSFRPVEVEGRAQSRRQDDSLLHVDAFPSRPARGERLLRVFTNVDPSGRPRQWRVGEPFPAAAARFLPSIGAPFPGSAAIMHALWLTKGRRSAYDHYMLRLHDAMKRDATYQTECPQSALAIPAGSSWIVFTDQVAHAAMSGQHAFEQTFTLPVGAMARPERSPLRIWEGLTGKTLL